MQQPAARMSQDVQLTSKGELEKIKCILSSTLYIVIGDGRKLQISGDYYFLLQFGIISI